MKKTVRSTILLKIEHICLEKIPNYNNGNMWVVDFWIIFMLLLLTSIFHV